MRSTFTQSIITTALGCMILFSCNEGNDLKSNAPQSYTVSGTVEKGPFVSGSSITLYPMDANMQTTGETYTTTIQDNFGNFSLGSKLFKNPYAELNANGYFFNEISGELSTGTLNLRAIVELADKSTVNVNILTHLKYQRILHLVAQGHTFKEANTQAQHELFAAFGLSKYAETDASHFSITQGNDEAAALIAVSSLFLINKGEAEITEYLAKLSSEFEDNGTFSEETKTQIQKDKIALKDKLEEIRTNIIERYDKLGQKIAVKELSKFVDWDNDGIAGNETLQEGEEVVLETTQLTVPHEGGNYSIQITSPIPVYLNPLSTEDDNHQISDDSFFSEFYENTNDSITIEKSLTGNTLNLKIATRDSRSDKSIKLPLYDGIGNIVANLIITQGGNPAAPLPLPGQNLRDALGGMAITLAQGFQEYNLIQQYYVYNKQANTVEQYIYPECSQVENMWSELYKFQANLQTIKNIDAEQLNVYQDILNVFSALQYYPMIVAWGNIPYITNTSITPSPQTDANTILKDLKNKLTQAIETLDEKKNEPLKDINDFFFISKDVARVVLADIYMYQNDYSNALHLLEQVINNGFYQLDHSNYSNQETINGIVDHQGGDEIIFALYNNTTRTRSNIVIAIPPLIPVQTYTEVILSYAECLYKQGNIQEAKNQLNKIITAKEITLNSNDVFKSIVEARKQLLLYTINNFAFMKRNGIAQEEYGIEAYRLLLPIPRIEIEYNPYITQNPGY